jgi:hypothetical protein
MQKNYSMEQKQRINDLQELYDYIESEEHFRIFDKDENSFIIQSLRYNTTWQIKYEVDYEIKRIISQTIEQLNDFDIDERFIELWDRDFPYSPSQFLRMLQEDEEDLKTKKQIL